MFDSSLFITVFADASHCVNTEACGIAYWIKSSEGTHQASFEVPNIKTSTQAEKAAIDKAIEYVINNLNYENKIMVVQSDCQGAMIDVNIPNKSKFKHIKFKWVKGHQNGVNKRSYVNELCDKMAKEKMRNMRERIERENISIYALPDVKPDPYETNVDVYVRGAWSLDQKSVSYDIMLKSGRHKIEFNDTIKCCNSLYHGLLQAIVIAVKHLKRACYITIHAGSSQVYDLFDKMEFYDRRGWNSKSKGDKISYHRQWAYLYRILNLHKSSKLNYVRNINEVMDSL